MAHSGNLPGWYPPKFKMIQQKDTVFKINDNASTFDYDHVPVGGEADTHINSLILNVVKPSNSKITNSFSYGPNNDGYVDRIFEINLNESGEYKISFEINWHNAGDFLTENYSRTYVTHIYVNPEDSELKPYSVADVLNRVLDLTPTRKVDEPRKYNFDEAQLEEFAKEESPEFAFTGHTLFEAMLLVAQYKGSFPELKGDTISFRKLWNGIWLTADDLPPPIEEVNSRDIDQYCTYLETEVQNLVGINDSQVGSITEPYEGGYRTTRSAGGSAISQDTAVISTDYNMYLHIKEEIGYIGSDLPSDNDITPYVYESGEYNSLTDMTAAYPASKAFALQWQQMGKNITELSHRISQAEDAIEIVQAFKEPAMANVIHAKTGINYGTGIVDYIQQMIGAKNSQSFADLMFRTTYIPVLNARVKQYKDYFGDFHYDGSIKYNQTAELVDSEMYGEHLKQLVRKIGNATKYAVYIFDKMDDVPKVGTVVDGYSIYDVKMSIRENKVIATIYYVKYAELSKYIGIKNPWKDSDVSVNKFYNRHISINEFLLFSNDATKKPNSDTVSRTALRRLIPGDSSFKLTCVEATGYSKDGSPLNTVLLPIVSLAMGNSLYFQWSYANNYSAGYLSEQAPDGATSVLSGTKYNRAQKAVRYADMYGRMETYDFSLLRTGPTSDDSTIKVNETSYLANTAEVTKTIAHSLPLKPSNLATLIKYTVDGKEYTAYSDGWDGEKIIGAEKLLVKKNSSEALTFSVQLHYCSDNENFIIGSGLTNFCSLVGGEAQEVGLYGFTERINIFKRRFSVGNATRLSGINISVSSRKSRIEITLPSSINSYNAWALMGKDKNGNYQIIFGENRALNGAEFKTALYLLPMHKLEDFI